MKAYLAALGISPETLAGRGLQECEEATDLEIAETADGGREHLLAPAAAAAWRKLKAAAAEEGVELFIVSAFRSVERQAEIVRGKLDAGVAIGEVLKVSAAPGYSEHHTGRAVDVSTPGGPLLETEFDRTAAFRWLEKRAGEFGFHLS